MKRTLAALSLAALTLPAYSAGLPYEQVQIDRALPSIQFAPVAAQSLGTAAPYEQVTIDRTLPELASPNARVAVASSGATRVDAGSDAVEAEAAAVWANDHNFIAPAQ